MEKGQGRLPPGWTGPQDTEDRVVVRTRLCHQDADMFPPPGLLDVSNPVQYIETSSGGDGDWLAFASTKLYTNAFILSPDPPQKVAS
jgi:hypothetical protein